MLTPPSRPQLAGQAVAVVAGMIAWLLIVPHVPILRDMPGMTVLAAFITLALLVDPRPALLGVLVGAVGLEMLRSPLPLANHIARFVVFVIVGAAITALVFARSERLRGAQIYRVLFEQHPLPVWVFDDETLRFLAVNDAALHAYGYTRQEFARMTLRDVRPGEDIPRLEARPWRGQPQVSGMWRHRTKDGTVREVFVRSQVLVFRKRRARMAIIEDMTERRSVEEQLRQAQKMEAIGQLAGGIAHDFNNLLTAIRGYAALLIEGLPEQDPRRQDAVEIDRAGERAASLTQQLLAFSRKQMLQVRVVSLTRTIEEMVPMLRRLVGESLEIRATLKAASRVRVDPTQLQQVLINLVVNARDALPRGGRIIVETADVELDDAYASQHSQVTPGPHAVLIVSDNGHGMDPATQQRIFEPFFTTKPPGQGTGLGLSTVYGIVKQTGGHVWVYSELGQGTTFKVYFPVTTAPEEQPSAGPAAAFRKLGHGTVLVVEDEDGVRSLLVRLLEHDGYHVLVAATPSAARAIWERPEVVIDLLVTDVVLPEMSGRQVAEAARAHHPGCRVLFMSGYTRDGVVTNGVLREDSSFLQKPFSAAELRRRVAETLAGGSGQAG
jgi:PAS domain S-box-containing protein